MEYIGKEIREQQRLTQDELAKKSGVSRSIICGLETGRTKTTTTKTLFRIADVLNVSINDLFSRVNA
jgi:transcriptional regulator with XRE-family HTH domain